MVAEVNRVYNVSALVKYEAEIEVIELQTCTAEDRKVFAEYVEQGMLQTLMLKGMSQYWFARDEYGEYETFSDRDVLRDWASSVSHVVMFRTSKVSIPQQH